MTPSAKTLAQHLFVDLVGRTMYASGTATEPDAEKLARFSIKFAETFERTVTRTEVEDDPNRPVKFDVQLDDIANWDVAKK